MSQEGSCLWGERHDGWADDHPEKMWCIIHGHGRPMTQEELSLKKLKEKAGRPRTKAEIKRIQNQALLEMF